jgi:hypothetical protein
VHSRPSISPLAVEKASTCCIVKTEIAIQLSLKHLNLPLLQKNDENDNMPSMQINRLKKE